MVQHAHRVAVVVARRARLEASHRHRTLLLAKQHLRRIGAFVLAAVVGGTGDLGLDKRKALMDDAPGQKTDELLVGPGGAARHIGGPGGASQLADVEGLLDVAVDTRRGEVALEGGGAHLAAGHAVDRVVPDDRREVDVAPRRMDQVVAADRHAVAVAHHDDHRSARDRRP